MKHYFLTTAATVMLLGAGSAYAQPYYNPASTSTAIVAPTGAAIITPGGTTMVPPGGTAIITTSNTTYYTPAGMPANAPLTLGQLIALRISDPDLASFKAALERTPIPENFDVNKGFTVFAPVNYNGEHPVDYYIVNDRMALNAMNGHTKVGVDHVTNLRGDTLQLSRIDRSYFVNSIRINNADRSPEGVIYTIGGMSDPAQL